MSKSHPSAEAIHPAGTLDSVTALTDAYAKYASARDYYSEENLDPTKDAQKDEALQAVSVIRTHREDVARVATDIYSSFGNIALGSHMEVSVPSSSTLGRELGIPTLPFDTTTPTPYESIFTTYSNLQRAQDFTKAGKDTLTGMLVSGSTAWGAFFATKADGSVVPYKQVGGTPERSDVDMIALAQDIEGIEATISAYVQQGLVESSELRRFVAYKSLHSTGQAKIYSVRTMHKSTEISIHFVTDETMCGISMAYTEHVSDSGISLLPDFRPNLPSNVRSNGPGYSIGDLKGLRSTHHKPKIHTVTSGSKLQGYISESPAGTVIEAGKELTYSMGLLDFFLAVKPIVLHDTDGALATHIEQLRSTIAVIQDGVEPVVLPRQNKMTRHVLGEVKRSLATI